MRRLSRFAIRAHRILGLILAINFLVFSLTGIILLWEDEFKSDLSQSVEKKTSETSPLHQVEKNLREDYPQKKILAIFKGDDGMINARLTSPGKFSFRGAEKLKFTQAGRPLNLSAYNSSNGGFFEVVLEIHRDLYFGGLGKILVGLLGIFLLLTLFLGLFVAPKFRSLKKSKRYRLMFGEFHRKLGIGTVSWALIVTFTGVVLAFDSYIIGYFLKSNFSQDVQRTEMAKREYVKAADVVDSLKKAAPEFRYDFISFPDNDFSLPGKFVVLMEKDREKKIGIVNGVSGNVEKVNPLPWYLRLIVISGPLHFGDYGGIFLKMGWMVMGIFVSLIPLSGILIFCHRKRFIDLERFGRLSFGGDWKTRILPTSSLLVLPVLFIFGAYYAFGLWRLFFAVAFLLTTVLVSWKSLGALSGRRSA